MPSLATSFGRSLRRAALAALPFLGSTALAEEIPQPTSGSTPAAENAGDQPLLGDWGGLRSALASYGLTFGVSETSEVLGNLTGGFRRGAIYEGLADANLQWDLQTAFKWPGVAFVRAFQIHGRGLSIDNIGNLMTASSIEALPSTRLFELWYEHYVSDKVQVKIGQQAADQEFLVSTTSRLFINATFGFPTLPAADLPSGGPAYPLGTPAVRLQLNPSDELVLLAAVFNGDPSGPGTVAPQARNASGIAFRTDDGLLAFFEAQYNPDSSPQNGTFKIGTWFHSGRFANQRFDTTGQSLASPLSTGVARRIDKNYSLYGVIDQPLWQASEADSSLAGFLRVMGAPGDRNLVDFYFDTGLAYKGPFGRTDDTVGVGFAYARIGSAARSLDRDRAAITPGYPVRSREMLLEVSYQSQLMPWWQLQPTFQYVFNPGGGLPNPNAPGRTISNAAILGLRTKVTF
ncbi:MAG: carbohydrate porin [Alphaproteobacteria bacterium]